MNRVLNGLSFVSALAVALMLGAAPARAGDAAPTDPAAVSKAASRSGDQAKMPAGVIELDETVISGNQELPKVLYIVPWQQPDGLPEIELRTEFTETELFRRLYPPAYRRELGYFEATGASAESNVSDSKE